MSDSLALPARDDADAKAWFYLEHREDIETWAALRTDGSRLLERYLVALVPALEELADELDAEAYTHDLDSGAGPRFGLRRAAWEHGGTQDVSVAAGWDRPRLLNPTMLTWPYVGVHLSQEDPQRRATVIAAVAHVRTSFTDKPTNGWPVWEYVKPAATEPGVDPEVMARKVWERLRELWHLAARDIDAIHGVRHD